MKLFLASSLDQTISLLISKLPKPAQECRVLFVANAADVNKDPWWVENDRKAFSSIGCEIEEVDLRKINKDQFSKLISGSEIIHFCGGSVFYLQSLLKKNGLDEVLKTQVRSGKILYTGTSAGSIIVSEKTDIYKNDPEEGEFASYLNEFSGLGLVNFLIVPYCNSEDFVEANITVVRNLPKFPIPLIFLHDNEVVWVEDGQIEILKLND